MSADLLRGFVERIERISEEIAGLQADRRDVIGEAKAYGFDAKVLQAAIRRRKIEPAMREEMDAVLASYEAALGGEPDAEPKLRPGARELAIELLAAQVSGLDDPDQAALLIEHVRFLLALREEIRELRAQESARKKLAAAEGFDAKQISVTVRWFEKVEKHGLDAMRAGEETFHLYRATVEGTPEPAAAPATNDPRLAAMFAPKPVKKPSQKEIKRLSARETARLAARALRGEL